MHTLRFFAMGSQVNALWDGSAAPPSTWDEMEELFEVWEQCLSRFRDESELSRLNRNAGKTLAVSEIMILVLQEAMDAARRSGGIVSPVLLPQLEAIGYTRDFECMRVDPAGAAESGDAAVTDYRKVAFDAGRRLLLTPPNARLDFGGIAKGWAADQVVRRFGGLGPVLIDVGGDIAVSGPRRDGTPWPVGVVNPLDAGEGAPLSVALIERGGIATSGRDYRRWQANGRDVHHIIDPRTGLPAVTDVLTATVIAPTAVEAESAAKVALIRGSAEGLEWLEEQGMAGLIVREDGGHCHNAGWERYDWSFLRPAEIK